MAHMSGSAPGDSGDPIPTAGRRTICWVPTWNKDRNGMGLEHLLLAERVADSIVLAFDEQHGPFRLAYRLTWDESWRLRGAALAVATDRFTRSLHLDTDGQGRHQQLPDSAPADGDRRAAAVPDGVDPRTENLDGTGFSVELRVDEDGIVVDYPELLRRVTKDY